jgi:Amt family ammonium transporter
MLLFRIRKGIDESLDAWSIHGIGGVWGVIATGIFASAAVNTYSGLLYGNTQQFLVQVVAAFSAVTYAFVVTFILAKVVDMAIGLRVRVEEEYVGLDISQHGERA